MLRYIPFLLVACGGVVDPGEPPEPAPTATVSSELTCPEHYVPCAPDGCMRPEFSDFCYPHCEDGNHLQCWETP